MKQEDPGYKCGRVPTKPHFSDADKAKRVVWCKLYVGYLADFWYNWVLVDEFTLYEKPEQATAIHRRGDDLTLTHSRLNPFEYGSYGTLAMCVAVNAHVGLVGKWWLHNTTGLKGPVYWVSAKGGGGAYLMPPPLCCPAQAASRSGCK